MKKKWALIVAVVILAVVAMITLTYTPPLDARPNGPTLRKRFIVDGGGSGFTVCSCYINASCDTQQRKCAAGNYDCEKCVSYDESGQPTGGYFLMCPGECGDWPP